MMNMADLAGVRMGGRRRSAAIASLLTVAMAASLLALTSTATPAAADTAPTSPGVPETVSSDPLPTVQINGVVWDQVVVGNRVYATGQFTQARPAGAAPGTNETPRSNILAFDINTGELITTWAPSLNAQGLTIAASADGSRIYVGGDFTSASSGPGLPNQNRQRVAAIDAQTGALVPGFTPVANNRVQSMAVNGNTLYVGGFFTSFGGQPRSRLGAVNATTGALLDWAPSSDREVVSMTVHPASGRVIVGGSFTTMNGVTQTGMTSLDGVSGALMPWVVNTIIRNSGPSTEISDLTTDGTNIYGTGWSYVSGGANANFEGIFSANALTGELNWVNGCRGDELSLVVTGDVIYTATHSHECGNVGWRPETNPRTWQWALAMDKRGTPGLYNAYGSYADWNRFEGRPASQFLHWLPTFSPGTFTTSGQAGWNVVANSQYVVYGGEFPRVNGINQQGFVRFATKQLAPNNDPIQGYPQLQPVATPVDDGTVRLEWQAAWDRDNARITYEVLRGATVNTSTVLRTFTYDSNWWTRPPLGFVDATAPPGSTQTYRIRVTSAFGNGYVGPAATVTIPAGTATPSPYRQSVLANGAFDHWRLGEDTGTAANDWANADDLQLSTAAVRGVPGALLNEPDTATSWPGTTSTGTVQGASQSWLIGAADPEPSAGPQVLSVEAWFRTSSTQGGKIVGFGDSRTGRSGRADRHLYMTNNGQIRFGVRPDGNNRLTINSQTGLNDNQWHHVVATLSSAGAYLYVDGRQVANDPSLTKAQVFYGYWRVAGDLLSSWPSVPAREAFAGSIDEVAIYHKALTLAQVQSNYNASGRTASNQPPTAAFTSTTSYLTASFDGSTSSDPENGTLTYAWSFGDGLSGSGVNPQHTYATGGTYPVTLTVTDPTTATNTKVGSVTVVANVPPTAAFTSTVSNLTASFDGSTSSDPEGGALSYTWSFGDGLSGSGATPQHTYAAAGTYPVTLTVTDPVNGSDTEVGSVTVTAAPNVPPTAAFTSTVSNLTASFDGSTSSDPEGGALSYVWSFGDGLSGSGANPQHTYAAAGTYPVTLTVTDPVNGSDTEVGSVTVTAAPNVPPTAAFTSTVSNLTASFDGSTSSDPEGGALTYTWSFGDGLSGSGATPQHTYAAAGTYPVTLTVTDPVNGSDTEVGSVTVTVEVARDWFERVVVNGLGTAEVGGPWTLTGAATNFSVNGGAARVVGATGATRAGWLTQAQTQDVNLVADVSLDRAITGNGAFVSLVGRRVSDGNDFRLKLQYRSNGTVGAFLEQTSGGVASQLALVTNVPGLTMAPGDVLRVRFEVLGTSPTTTRAKVWRVGTPEPSAWLVTSTAVPPALLQGSGHVGVHFYTSGSWTGSGAILTIDNLSAKLAIGG